MAIQVTCPSCFKRFTVSDKFAGKSGPCPNCKKTIKIPDKSEQVVIHAPEDTGPKDSKGRSVLKPIRRREVALSLPVILAAALGTIVVFGIAIGLGLSGGAPTALVVTSSLLLAFPLSFIGYWFLHDDELEGFTGRQLLIRCSLAALAFAATWGIYWLVPTYLFDHASTAEISALEMAIFILVMIGLGTATAILIFELEFLQGLLQYMLYFVLTFILAWLAGVPLGEPLSGTSSPRARTLPATSPRVIPPSDSAAPPAEKQEEKGRIPNLLQ
jgi:hypothetical protein